MKTTIVNTSITAGQHAQKRVVTISVDGMSFIRPVHVGDILGIYTEIKEVGTTSMSIHVEAWVRRQRIDLREKVTEVTFKFVTLDNKTKKSSPLPKPEELPDYVREKFCI